MNESNVMEATDYTEHIEEADNTGRGTTVMEATKHMEETDKPGRENNVMEAADYTEHTEEEDKPEREHSGGSSKQQQHRIRKESNSITEMKKIVDVV